GFLVGLGVAGTGLGILMGTVSRAVPPERRSQAVGTVAALGSLGTLFLAPTGQWLIDGFGWRSGLFAFAGVASSMALVALAFSKETKNGETPEVLDDRSLGETLREAATHPGYIA